MFPPTLVILMHHAISLGNPVQAALDGKAEYIRFIDQEFLYEGELLDVLSVSFQSVFLLGKTCEANYFSKQIIFTYILHLG